MRKLWRVELVRHDWPYIDHLIDVRREMRRGAWTDDCIRQIQTRLHNDYEGFSIRAACSDVAMLLDVVRDIRELPWMTEPREQSIEDVIEARIYKSLREGHDNLGNLVGEKS